MIPVRRLIFCVGIFVSTALVSFADSFPSSGPTTPGNEARLRGSVALAPVNAPAAVKRAIWAANQLRTKPYRYGGGHKSFHDSGYDCSGTISYALAGAGLVSVPLSSNELRAYGWIRLHRTIALEFGLLAGNPTRACLLVSKRAIHSVCNPRSPPGAVSRGRATSLPSCS
jgi:hypothetical protein